jgi:fluoride exporter
LTGGDIHDYSGVMRFLLICLGGAVGTGARYGVQVVAVRWLGTGFPYGTLAVNVLGSFLIGLINEVAFTTSLIPPTIRVMLTIGVMGGFTTYSSFSFETLELAKDGAWLGAGVNVLLNTALCLAGCGLGMTLGRVIAR